jgi:hypothetical protein
MPEVPPVMSAVFPLSMKFSILPLEVIHRVARMAPA